MTELTHTFEDAKPVKSRQARRRGGKKSKQIPQEELRPELLNRIEDLAQTVEKNKPVTHQADSTLAESNGTEIVRQKLIAEAAYDHEKFTKILDAAEQAEINIEFAWHEDTITLGKNRDVEFGLVFPTVTTPDMGHKWASGHRIAWGEIDNDTIIIHLDHTSEDTPLDYALRAIKRIDSDPTSLALDIAHNEYERGSRFEKTLDKGEILKAKWDEISGEDSVFAKSREAGTFDLISPNKPKCGLKLLSSLKCGL